jgi:hypothetical protein
LKIDLLVEIIKIITLPPVELTIIWALGILSRPILARAGRKLARTIELKTFDRISYFVAHGTSRISILVRETIERGIDSINTIVANGAKALYFQIRKIQTGILSYNLAYVIMALLIMTIVLLIGRV